jgi:type I restriction enzyme M protein
MLEQTIKNIDNILHKDTGCRSEADYVEQTSWVLVMNTLDLYIKKPNTPGEAPLCEPKEILKNRAELLKVFSNN